MLLLGGVVGTARYSALVEVGDGFGGGIVALEKMLVELAVAATVVAAAQLIAALVSVADFVALAADVAVAAVVAVVAVAVVEPIPGVPILASRTVVAPDAASRCLVSAPARALLAVASHAPDAPSAVVGGDVPWNCPSAGRMLHY